MPPDDGTPAAVRTLTLASAVFRNTRSIRVYLPPGYESPACAAARYPALILNDGFAVFSERAWNAPRQLDGLIRAAPSSR
jgi:enterochelin esterase-like enzyme